MQYKKVLKAGLVLISMPLVTSVYALDLDTQRTAVVGKYVKYLGEADYKKLSSLFTKNGTVSSTSRGSKNAKEFFTEFLPNVKEGKTVQKQAFIKLVNADDGAKITSNRYADRFHLNLKLKNGEEVNGEFIDEFIFEKDSAKLKAVYMFENLHFNVKD